MTKPGNWGNWATIEKVRYPIKKVSCYTCVNYIEEDGSCSVTSHIPKLDGKAYWKKCREFKLSPEYTDRDMKQEVLQIKGKNFLQDSKSIVKTGKECNDISMLNADTNKIGNGLVSRKSLHIGIQFNRKTAKRFRKILAKYYTVRNEDENARNIELISNCFSKQSEREKAIKILEDRRSAIIQDAMKLLPSKLIEAFVLTDINQFAFSLSIFLIENGSEEAPIEKYKRLCENIMAVSLNNLLGKSEYMKTIADYDGLDKKRIVFLDALSSILVDARVLPIDKYKLDIEWLETKVIKL